MGVDYDRDGRVTPFGRPDDSLAGTARYLVERGNYRRGEAWGCEVNVPASARVLPTTAPCATYAHWHALGITRADGTAFARPHDQVEAVAAGTRRPGLPGRAEFPRGLFLQPVDQPTRSRSAISAT